LRQKNELDLYRKYFDRVEELMMETEKTAPYATIALRRGLPILDRKLRSLLEEIQVKAKTAFQVSKGTFTEEITKAVNSEIQKWEIGSQEEMSYYVNNLVVVLKSKIPLSPENKGIIDMIEHMKNERDLTKQYSILPTIIALIPTVNVIPEQELNQKLLKFDQVYDDIATIKDKLSCISFDISNIKWNSADIVSNLKTMKEKLENLNRIEGLNALSIENLHCSQKDILNELNINILESLNEIGILAKKLPNKEDTQKILDSVNKLKQTKPEILFKKSLDIIALIGFAIEVFPYLHL
jgi:hypothetical protein